MDLGCRNAGVLCRCMEQFGSRIQKAVGVDARDTGFGEIPYGEPIELRVMDCAQPLDFPDNAVDLVFSKDMFECVTDKEALVQDQPDFETGEEPCFASTATGTAWYTTGGTRI